MHVMSAYVMKRAFSVQVMFHDLLNSAQQRSLETVIEGHVIGTDSRFSPYFRHIAWPQ